MIKLTLLFGERENIKKAASASNYNGHRLHLRRKPDWLYCADRGPLFSVAVCLWHFKLCRRLPQKTVWESLVEEAKKYRCYLIYPDTPDIVVEISEQNAAVIIKSIPPAAIGQLRFLVVHFKLFRSKRVVEDVDRILDEAKRLEVEAANERSDDGIAVTDQLLNTARFLVSSKAQSFWVNRLLEKGSKLLQGQLKHDGSYHESGDAEMKIESEDDNDDDDDSDEDNQLEVKLDEKEDSEPIKRETDGTFDKMLFTLNYPALELFPSQRSKTPSFCFRSVSVTTLVRQYLSESKTFDAK